MKAREAVRKVARLLSSSTFLSGWLGVGRGINLLLTGNNKVVLIFPYKRGVTFTVSSSLVGDTPSVLLLRLVEEITKHEGFRLCMLWSEFRGRPAYFVSYQQNVRLYLFFPTLNTLEAVVLYKERIVKRFYIRNLARIPHKFPQILSFCDALSL